MGTSIRGGQKSTERKKIRKMNLYVIFLVAIMAYSNLANPTDEDFGTMHKRRGSITTILSMQEQQEERALQPEIQDPKILEQSALQQEQQALHKKKGQQEQQKQQGEEEQAQQPEQTEQVQLQIKQKQQ